jgi:hypothetical protein
VAKKEIEMTANSKNTEHEKGIALVLSLMNDGNRVDRFLCKTLDGVYYSNDADLCEGLKIPVAYDFEPTEEDAAGFIDNLHELIELRKNYVEVVDVNLIPEKCESIIYHGLEDCMSKDLIKADVREWCNENDAVFSSSEFDLWFRHIQKRDFQK